MNRRILNLAIPNIISNLTVPLLSSVDTALVGHLAGVHYLGAIAVGGMIFNFIYWGFGFLRMGTTGLTAQAFGRKNDSEAVLLLARALLVAVAFGVFLILIRKYILELSFFLVNTSAAVEKEARIYFQIRILAAPATLALYALTGWFLGMQNARYPLILAVFTNLVNIVLNIYFLKVEQMTVDGIALGTMLANYGGVFLALVLFRLRYRNLLAFFPAKELFAPHSFRQFISLNRDIFIRTLVLIFAFSFFTAKSAEAGDMILAANSILMNLWTIMAYGIDGFAFAAESLIGRYFGAADRIRLKEVIKKVFMWGTGLAIFISLVYGIFARPILAVFTDKPSVIDLAAEYMIWTIFAPLINSFCYLWDGIFIGATAGPAMRNSVLFCLFIIFLPAFYLTGFWGNHGLWLAMSLFMFARGLTLFLLFRGQILDRMPARS